MIIPDGQGKARKDCQVVSLSREMAVCDERQRAKNIFRKMKWLCKSAQYGLTKLVRDCFMFLEGEDRYHPIILAYK